MTNASRRRWLIFQYGIIASQKALRKPTRRELTSEWEIFHPLGLSGTGDRADNRAKGRWRRRASRRKMKRRAGNQEEKTLALLPPPPWHVENPRMRRRRVATWIPFTASASPLHHCERLSIENGRSGNSPSENCDRVVSL